MASLTGRLFSNPRYQNVYLGQTGRITESGGDLIFIDDNAGQYTLSALASGGVNEVVAGIDNYLARYHNANNIQRATTIVVDDLDNISGVAGFTAATLTTQAATASMDTDDILETGLSGGGQLVVSESTTKITGLFRLDHDVVVDLGSHQNFSESDSVSGRLCVYYDTDQVKVKNLLGDGLSVTVGWLGV